MSPRSYRRASPFSRLRISLGFALAYMATALVWAAAGSRLPGGRWFAIHLFTLGVLTNLIGALMPHFAQALLHCRALRIAWQRAIVVTLDAGILVVLLARLSGNRWALAAGASLFSVAVSGIYVELRRVRKGALPSRFAFVVRTYERACSAVLHGAVLGALIGAGILRGGWYPAARVAHMHLNVLGWGGLALLATVVTFGPTVMRVRIEEGADVVAAKRLPQAATALSVAALALFAGAAGGTVGTSMRWIASAALVAYGACAFGICRWVLVAARRAAPSGSRLFVMGACLWFVGAVWADAAVVLSGRAALFDSVGVVVLVGVLAQTILAALSHLLPTIWGRDAEARERARVALEALPRLRAGALNAGIVLVTAAIAAGAVLPARLGWALIVAAVAVTLALMARARAVAAGILPFGGTRA